MSYQKIISSLLATTVLACSAFADGILDANSATANELSDIGENAAAVIVAGRPFKTIGDLNAALGSSMSEDDLEALYGKVFVPIDLNSASREDILLIPGVGGRMAHEFEEYRPYTSMEQFRREMGKYVDDEEVARLEMYVTLD
jgi:DNA uptake protein ComE-like DNA-binding protein